MTRTWVGTITAFYVITVEGLIIPLLGKVQSDTKGWGMKEKGGSDIRFAPGKEAVAPLTFSCTMYSVKTLLGFLVLAKCSLIVNQILS